MTGCYLFNLERMATELSIPIDLFRLSLLFFNYLIIVITFSYFDVNYLLIININMAFICFLVHFIQIERILHLF